jgi:pimeloyl-ACP methyl ester carboxylesterase
MLNLDEWLGSGERLKVEVPSGTFAIFCRTQGSGPWLTFLHSFPTSSWDWAKVADRLAERHRCLFIDFLGFGDSDKPAGHEYRLVEQAGIVEALWRHYGVDSTGLVAHDYGGSVAQELLARQAAGQLGAQVRAVVFLNSTLYPDLHRPVRLQQLLRNPVLGPIVSRLISEKRFSASFAAVFSRSHPIDPEELHQHWLAVERRQGVRRYPRLIAYLGERQQQKARWQGAIEGTQTPLRFLWGMADTVSGPPIAEQIRARIPNADLVELPDVGHYPQIEVPQRVAEEIAATFAAHGG